MRQIAGILEIGNHPPPVCGWSIQTTLVKQELLRRGFPVSVLNIGENRRRQSPEYIDVQGGFDFIQKLIRFCWKGYRFHIHFNAHSKKGLILAYIAGSLGAALGPTPVLSFHGGLPQAFFPPSKPLWTRYLVSSLFRLRACITCDSEEIRSEILKYEIDTEIRAIPCVSAELLNCERVEIPSAAAEFIKRYDCVFFSYVRLRTAYGFPVLLEAMRLFTQENPRVGFIWMGPSEPEMRPVSEIITSSGFPKEKLLLLPNADHELFLSTMSRCTATIRSYQCDGVSASVLESLSLGIPVIACEDGRRPAGVITYDAHDPNDLCQKMHYVLRNYDQLRRGLPRPKIERNTERLVKVLLT